MESNVKSVISSGRNVPMTMESVPGTPSLSSMTPPSKRRIIRNLLFLAFGHFLVFTSFDSLSNLQSTINSEGGVGIASQAAIYASFTLSSFFLPSLIIKKFGSKTALVISIFCVCPYIAANMYPTWITLFPTALLSGLAFGPLWAARSTYVNDISHQYSALTGTDIDVVNAWFFGIYSFFHENAEIWGNVISYFVLKNDNSSEVSVSNQTNWTCGAEFCADNSEVAMNPNLVPPPDGKRYSLCSIYIVLVIVAGVVVKFLLDPTDSEKNNCSKNSTTGRNESVPWYKLLVATFQHHSNANQILLLPLSFYCGLADGFYNSDFTKAFIACSWGISQVGFVTISYGVICAIVDCTSGVFVKYFGRATLFAFGAVSHFAMLTACLLWKPDPSKPFAFFLLAGAYGLGASVWWSQIAAFYGVVFKNEEEAAFSSFYFWSSLGLLVAYAYSNYVCTKMKIFALIILLAVSIVSYLAVELRLSSPVRETNHHQALRN